MSDTPLLETRGVSVRFGGHVAVKDVSLTVQPGTVTGLIGPNGAGKTTLFNTITGLQKPTSGQVFLGGVDVTKLPPHKRAMHAYHVLGDVLTPAEVIVETREEFEERSEWISTVERTIKEKGQVIYERTG